ncbi:MAG: hypothetical protein M1830_008823 [Pleopsidium flavum]|nr:MAG: hypothetical protein M1830_008823 [Pleopsidium flavum]
MADLTALAALVVAVAALLITTLQLTQQLLATAYVIRKCDRIVTGGLTRGGTRQWHWRQFRFTVKYQAIVFALPAPLYSALGVRPTVQVDSPSHELCVHAMKLRPNRTTTQGCWVSFIQDMVMSACIRPEDLCVREESGDRIPEDLTVAPTRVDAIMVMLICVALGMQVSKYSPTTGEISLAGGVGGISSSVHPVLGGLLHYSVFSSEPTIGFEAARRHGRALLQEKGVWAHTVFGKFKDRSYRPEFTVLGVLIERKESVLRARGWPEDSYIDTIGGAACFMAFGHIDVYEAVPSSCVRRWCAHFAEVIVQAHHLEISKRRLEAHDALPLSPSFYQARQKLVERHGCSSPYLPWEDCNTGETAPSEKISLGLQSDSGLPLNIEPKLVLAYPDLMACAVEARTANGCSVPLALDERDPSSYVPTAAAWEAILRADQYMRYIYKTHGLWPDQEFGKCADKIVASAICSPSEVGPPSWGGASKHIEEWLQTFSAACREVLRDQMPPVDNKWVSTYAHFSILRAAYYTIMMRAAGDIGPGLTEETLKSACVVVQFVETVVTDYVYQLQQEMEMK